MAQDGFIRAANRTRLSALTAGGQGALTRFKSGLGLTAANTIDRFNGVFRNPAVSFFAGGTHGAMRGALKGFVMAIFAIAIFGVATVSGLTMVLAASGAGALVWGAMGSQKALDRNVAQPASRLADKIAVGSGAVARKELAKTDNPGEIIDFSSHPDSGKTSFAARERERKQKGSQKLLIG